MLPFAHSLQEWSQIAEIATGVGVFFVLVQVWQAARSSRVELITGLTTLIVDIDRLFIAHPGMEKHFSGRADPPEKGTDEWERVHATAMAMANTLDHVVEHLGFMKRRTSKSWKAYIAEVYETSVVFKELLDEHRKWWPGLQRQVRGTHP